MTTHTQTQKKGRIASYMVVLVLSLLALGFAWTTVHFYSGELRSLPASYKLNAADLQSIEQSVRNNFAWALVPLAVIVVVWAIAAWLYLSEAQRENVKDEHHAA
jgi:NADH:ubiquinone oxidoreductase subunit 5 (subunit L)/multisubunit Na+/H+ antiporter MnhA subunit